MKLNCEKLKSSIKKLSLLNLQDAELKRFLRLKKFSEKNINEIINYLSEKLLEKNWTVLIAREFKEFLLLLVANGIPLSSEINDFVDHQNKCIVLSKLIHENSNVLEYSLKFFINGPAPFDEINTSNEEKRRKLTAQEPNDIDIITCCYNLVTANSTFFRDIWDWSLFLKKYFSKGDFQQQIYCNKIVAALTDMTESQLSIMNSNIPSQALRDFDEIENINKISEGEVSYYTECEMIEYHCSNDAVVNVEEVLLPVYDKENYDYYKSTANDEIIRVDSTKINLRNIAIGVSSGKTICISGPVGCGKTILIEYLAKITGRIHPSKKIYNDKFFPHENEKILENDEENISSNIKVLEQHNKRKNEVNLKTSNRSIMEKNGFLRIQLGDQTDSKMLLGQYHCTDIPGDFVWSPGVLTQAVMNGLWLLLEDIDLATQDTFTILSNLLETRSLSVPGFKDVVKIAPGFQLFVSLRTGNSINVSQKSYVSLLNKYLYTVNVIPLSKQELSYIVSESYSNLKDIAMRMVDMYLNFSDENQPNTNLEKEINNRNLNFPNNLRATSERLVSTRDFIKLCQRSDPTYSKTSAECAFFIFQNAVDLFCSHLQQGELKLRFITNVGSKLGINPSRCEHYANEYKPDVYLDDFRIKIGRAELRRKSKHRWNTAEREDVINKKRIKLSENVQKEISFITKTKKVQSDIFSFTRISLVLLEKIAVCVNQNEPVLLVGETGVGKTSSVHYLANQTNHTLVVVNMNNQSDVSDLIGGFKPVDLSYVMMPLRIEFESLFRKTFNELKNEKFLSKISICYNQGNFEVIIKLILKIIESVFEKAKVEPNTIVTKYLTQWILLQKKVYKLCSQLQKSTNISFAFIPGALVNCIQNGDWILLDEINLASTETLECLSTILEPNGSIILIERGDFSPIERNSNFRIFACMNPNTDIGKKDLPTGIRNRFTEFYVDELTTDYDLTLLVNDYLLNTGIKKVKISNIVKLYKNLRSLSQLELNDGLGNRPVYSLRNLCRALKISSKNLCGSIERNLYESFCLSFLTQLDITSHKVVLALIKENMLMTSVNAVLSQNIPKPGEGFLNFEGYWIEQGTNKLLECEHYILTDSVQQNLKDLARIISIGKLPILLQGPTSAGKTSLIEYIAKKSGNTCLRVNNHEHTDLQEYIGTYLSDASGKLSFKEGVLVQAMRNGFWIILDELNLASSDILEALNRVLDDNRELFIPETQTVVKAHRNFMLFATQNPPGLYGGRKTLSRAFKNRFVELHFSEIPSHELEVILEKRCLIPKSYSQKMVKCMNDLQTNRKTTSSKSNFTLRDLFRWGNRYTHANKKLLEDNSYDWNQHLVDEGYLVLSAKVRTEIEEEIVAESLKKHFKKSVDPNSLFELNYKTSLVTKEILHNLHEFKIRNDIVWTYNLRRVAVLTAKSLQFNEPVLLVGPTGCGKTTICQILANIANSNLRILNCHMHTEGADFLGGLRPYRNEDVNIDKEDDQKKTTHNTKKLFEWVDGPLVKSMEEGCYFMIDEISLAEDSVLERLNSVLEPERLLLLAEKGGIIENNSDKENVKAKPKEFVIQAKETFKFLATMNPGGDFGKKELSPALRNRFTEIWCKPSTEFKDLENIITNIFNISKNNVCKIHELIANIFVKVVFYIKEKIEKFKFSVRDVIAWALYIVKNSKEENLEHLLHNKPEILIFGLETIFLDSLEMLCQESLEVIEETRELIIDFLIKEIKGSLNIAKLTAINHKRGKLIEFNKDVFGISPFYIEVNKNLLVDQSNFFFEAPTTKKNLFRLLSALTLEKAILLEGPPGVGKTSIIESLANQIGFKIVRINLCEHTDLADLFGTDLPVEESSFMLNYTQSNDRDLEGKFQPGTFKWHNGPLLSALTSKNVWILLDELNLAPQSVLEGLNAVLDHRGEIFIPELNKTFKIERGTKIFACQNPLRQGGGRKGLPQSFLNRFTKVFLRKLNVDDLLYVINNKYKDNFQEIANYFKKYLKPSGSESISFFELLRLKNANCNDFSNLILNYSKLEFDLSARMVEFSEKLALGLANLEFGYQGGPYEINLRDILRWCDSLFDKNTGFVMRNENDFNDINNFILDMDDFVLNLYERMKLIYLRRMRSDQDRFYIFDSFSKEFNCDAQKLEKISEDISFYFTEDTIYLSDIMVARDPKDQENVNRHQITKKECLLILNGQKEILKNILECVHIEKPVLLCGNPDAGKTKVINILSDILNKTCHFDNIDDSVTGSFQQIDFTRHFEEMSSHIEKKLITYLQDEFVKISSFNNKNWLLNVCKLLQHWHCYTKTNTISSEMESFQSIRDSISVFNKRIEGLKNVIICLIELVAPQQSTGINIDHLKIQEKSLNELKNFIKKSETINSGGYFEWIDSKIVKCLKYGDFVCLEHANLCSSAVLDRLNSVFEPEGQLLISEKGIAVGCDAEVIKKHKDFRAFLTLDPKNGELSRAMRNRCIEIALKKHSYSNSDLKKIIFSNGILKSNCINAILYMYTKIKSLADLNNFNISHLIQVTFLVSAYNTIGFDDCRSIYLAGMDIFVISSKTDLMGYGLDFYKDKLKEIVCEACDIVKNERIKRIDLNNIILTSKNLNSLSFVKLQSEPFSILLNNYANFESAREDLKFTYDGCDEVEFTNDELLLKFYIFVIYQTSKKSDIKYRYYVIEKLLEKCEILPTEIKENLLNINKNLLVIFENQCLKYEANMMIANDLPWNMKMFPRIRSYKNISDILIKRNFESKLTANFVFEILEQKLPNEEKFNLKQNQITIYGYSYAIYAKIISDNLHNDFLKYLYTFIKEFKLMLKQFVDQIDNKTESFVEYILRLLWLRRCLKIANMKLYEENGDVNQELLNQLYLHFKWIGKKIINRNVLSKSLPSSIYETYGLLANYLEKSTPNLDVLKKYYVKLMTHFNVSESIEKIQYNQIVYKFDSFLNLIPQYGKFNKDIILKKFHIINSQENQKIKSLLLNINYNTFMNEIRRAPDDIHKTNKNETTLEKILYQFQKNQLECDYSIEEIDFETLNTTLKYLDTIISDENYNIDNLNLNMFDVEIFPLKEYYLNNIFVYVCDHNSSCHLNKNYIKTTPSLKLADIQLFEILSTDEYRNFNKMWSYLFDYINEDGYLNKLFRSDGELLKLSYYKKYSTFDQKLENCIKSFKLSNLKLKSDCCFDVNEITEINCEMNYSGPYLINILNKLLLTNDGELRQIAIKELPKWEIQLKQISELLWFNSCISYNMHNIIKNYQFSIFYVKKLLFEIEFIFKEMELNVPNTLMNNAYESFFNLVNQLKNNIEIPENIYADLNSEYTVNDLAKIEQKTALMYSLMGLIKLHLMTFLPIVDPIDKNYLKKKYLNEDINLLESLSSAYHITSIAMDYNNFGGEYRLKINEKLEKLINKKQKYLQKHLEKRPEGHLYSKMVEDITHYLNINCNFNHLLAIVSKISNCLNSKNGQIELEREIIECIRMINVWLLNSQQFLQQIFKKYPSYKEDLLYPIECAINMTRYGFESFKNNLVQMKNLLIFEMENNNLNKDDLYQVLEYLTEYPNQNLLTKNVQDKLFKVLERIKPEEYEILHINVLKIKISEIQISASTLLEIDEKIFSDFYNTFNLINRIWKNQEDIKTKKQIEKENLYVIKTRCENNFDEDDFKEIQELFPTTINEDFPEFLEINSLENNMENVQININKTENEYKIISENEFKFVVESFMEMLDNYSITVHSASKINDKRKSKINFSELFNNRLKIFKTIFEVYKPGLNEVFDSKLFNTFNFVIKLHHDQINTETVKNVDEEIIYNIYKSSNIPEINSCVSLLEEIINRVNKELALYPEHATLIDILKITRRISKFSITSPVVRFNTGFQLLRQKISQWNDVAHKNNHMQGLEIRIAEFVQRWTKLELRFWRNCLSDIKKGVETSSYKYWFFIYNLIHEFLKENEFEEQIEQQTGYSDFNGIIKVLKQFLESSNYADFSIKLKLLKSFELYLNFLIQYQNRCNINKSNLISVIYNIRTYYEQFNNEIDEFKKNLLLTAEKKIKELVKIESYNKDLSYFSMKNNIAKVHRNLNKFIKEYENGLKESISKVFDYKEENISDLSTINDKGGKYLRNDPKVKYYMVDTKHFISSQISKDFKHDSNDETISNASLNVFNRFEKLFLTSRNLCKELIPKISYPILTSNLEGLLSNYFETYEYLHNLNVDRNQDKKKQIAQNKNFLQQKRKALSDVFKTLTVMGLNYKTGLAELSIAPDISDLNIKPFLIDNLLLNISKSKTLNQNFTYLNENLNLYYTRSTYKMKILQNILLNPNAELGPANIDRIKGFSIDLFLLVQKQRKLLSTSMNTVNEFRKNIGRVNQLIICCQNNDYDELKLNFLDLENQLLRLKEIFNEINIFFVQFKTLLEIIPSESSNTNSVFENHKMLTKHSDKYEKILGICEKILEITKETIKELKKISILEPLNYKSIEKLINNKEKCLKFLVDLQSEFNIIGYYSPMANSLVKLKNFVTELENNTDIKNSTVDIDINMINTEIDNVLHIALIAIQNLFKKYNTDVDFKERNKDKLNVVGESEIYKNHLKEKLYKEMMADFKELNMKKICLKIQNIYLAIKYFNYKTELVKKISSIMPILDQYSLLSCYHIFQQLGAHRVSAKMLYVMLSAFIELASKGFCSPLDLIQDENGQQQQQNSKSEGGGFSEDKTIGNEKDVSDKIENEDQLDDARKPEDRQNNKDENNKNCEEEKGIEMSDNFDADLQDFEKDEESDNNSKNDDDEDDFDKEMGDTEKGVDKLDEQIWGSDNDEPNSADENEVSDDDFGEGCKNENETHNDLDAPNDKSKNANDSSINNEQLDSVGDEKNNSKEKKQKADDIDNMAEAEIDEEHINPYHNNLEEPPETEDMQLDDNVNLDEGTDRDKEQSNNLENPFDIDKMKETMELDENLNENDLDNNEKNVESNISDNGEDDSDEECYNNLNDDKDTQEDEKEDNVEEKTEKVDNSKFEDPTNNMENLTENENNEEEKIEEQSVTCEESISKPSKEDNMHTNEVEENKVSNDQVQNPNDHNIQQDQNLDDQETGEEGQGVGQAKNEMAEGGHQSVSETVELNSVEKNSIKKESKIKNKPNKTDENRTLGEHNSDTLKNLKTINKNIDDKEVNEKSERNENVNSDEYHHIKDPEQSEITAVDNATEEQSKQVQHLNDKEEYEEEVMDNVPNEDAVEKNVNEEPNELNSDSPEIKPEKNKQHSDKYKSSEINEMQSEAGEEKIEIQGENVDTLLPLRGCDTIAHCLKENLLLLSVHEPTDADTVQMRKIYYEKLGNIQKKKPQTKDFEIWQSISSLMLSNARDLCEQLRLILEPTKCTKLKGDYKTGRRINMKKIIPYIASQFRKDKIWLRRTKPSQRDYKITIAIDDSKSMHHNNSKEITLKTISLVSQALTLLESGKLNILSFGESPQIILSHTDQFDGPKLVNSLNFDQNQSKIAELLDFTRTLTTEEAHCCTDNRLFENLLLILSDGRNIFSEGEQKVKNSIKLAKLQRIFVVYIIIDNPENKHSILDIRVPYFTSDKKSISMKSYLDTFPFPYYVIVRDLDQLPMVLSEAMRQWFELVNSEQ